MDYERCSISSLTADLFDFFSFYFLLLELFNISYFCIVSGYLHDEQLIRRFFLLTEILELGFIIVIL